jgi:hypothetical protein
VICRLTDSPAVTEDLTNRPLVLDVELDPGDASAPLRVLSLLARRQCRILRAAFALAEGPEPATMRVELEPPPRGEAAVERWVRSLISVLAVARVSS